jgi:uncharacterized membrane protein
LIDDEVKVVMLIMLFTSATIAIYPILVEYRAVEPFSELGVLGPYGKLGDYPRELVVGQEISLFLYVGNHEGRSEYYQVVAKLGDKITNVSDTSPLDRPSVKSWDTILENESNTTIPINISISEAGLNRRLIFELWKYDSSSHTFIYYQRWSQLWLNVTTPG